MVGFVRVTYSVYHATRNSYCPFDVWLIWINLRRLANNTRGIHYWLSWRKCVRWNWKFVCGFAVWSVWTLWRISIYKLKYNELTVIAVYFVSLPPKSLQLGEWKEGQERRGMERTDGRTSAEPVGKANKAGIPRKTVFITVHVTRKLL
jgi:hypothetical protein